MSGSAKSTAATTLLLISVMVVVVALTPSQPQKPVPTFSEFLKHIERREVHDVQLRTRENSVRVRLEHGTRL